MAVGGLTGPGDQPCICGRLAALTTSQEGSASGDHANDGYDQGHQCEGAIAAVDTGWALCAFRTAVSLGTRLAYGCGWALCAFRTAVSPGTRLAYRSGWALCAFRTAVSLGTWLA